MSVMYSVEKLDLAIEKSVPPNLIITVEGSANTGGWSDFALSKVAHVAPPEDGVQEYFFVGKAPTGGASQAIDPGKIAHARIDELDQDNYWGAGIPLKGIRVTAATNEMEQALI